MRSLNSRTLTAPTFIGLILAPPTVSSSAMAAKGRHVAQSSCRRLDQGQVIGAVLSMPWFAGRPGPHPAFKSKSLLGRRVKHG
jgi:hypothetical protein